MENKKIIGYKLRDKAYEYAALVLLGQKDYLTFKEYAGAYPLPEPMCFKENCDFSRALEEAGVLDLWFVPLYKKDKFSAFSHSKHGITFYKGVALSDKFIKGIEFCCVTSFQMKVNGVKHNFSKADVELIKEYVKTLG